MFFNKYIDNHIEEYRFVNPCLQQAYNKRFGLISFNPLQATQTIWFEYATYSGIFHHKGMCLLQNYYAYKPNRPAEPIYILKGLRDLDFFFKIAPTNCGIVLRNYPYNHKTPIVKRDKTLVILESISLTKYASSKLVGSIIAKEHPELHVINVDFQRQSDSFSCSTDALVVLKEALRLGEKLLEFLENHYKKYQKYDMSPPSIAKYSQLIKFFQQQSAQDYKYALVKINKKDSAEESMMQYVHRHLNATFKYNNSLEKRRHKHLRIIVDTLTKEKTSTIKQMISEASGVNVMTRNITKLSAFLNQKKPNVQNVQYQKKLQEFINSTEDGNFELLALNYLGSASK
jgi:hypothetical protein